MPQSPSLQPVKSLWERTVRLLPSLPIVHESGEGDHQLISLIQGTSLEVLLGGEILNRDMAKVNQAALLMIAGDWDGAHHIVQELDTPEARYWHGILHRREPDTSNACYWFRRVPAHPVYTSLASSRMKEELSSNSVYTEVARGGIWDPITFAEQCQPLRDGELPNSAEDDLRILQYHECLLLLDYCRAQALGNS